MPLYPRIITHFKAFCNRIVNFIYELFVNKRSVIDSPRRKYNIYTYSEVYMKKILIILLLCLILCSCTKPPTADDITLRALELYKIPPVSQYVKTENESSDGYISPEDFSYLYTGEKEYLPEWELISDFRIVMSKSSSPFELHVIRLFSSTDAEEIAKVLQKRADMIKYHNKTELDYLTYDPEVIVKGRYVILAVTEDNEAVKLLLKRIL